MRSLAAPIIIAPDADIMASTWNSGPSIPSRREVAVADQGGQQHGDGHHDLDEDVEPVEGDGAGDGDLGAVGAHLVPLEEGGHQGGDRHDRGDQRARAHTEAPCGTTRTRPSGPAARPS